MSQNRPAITVLMPVYNAETFLREALESVLLQTFTDFELLVINDGSTDTSAALLAGYTDVRLRVVHNQQNLGLIATLNKGLDLATGLYVARMDADDISHPVRLERQFRYMEQHPQIVACGSWLSVIDGNKQRTLRFPVTHEQHRCGLLFDSTIPHPSAMLRRETLELHGLRYSPTARHAEDYELWLRLSRVGQLACLPEVLLTYRRHSGQVSQSKQNEQLAAAGRIRRSALAYYGVELTEADFNVHQALGSGIGLDTRQFWQQVDVWAIRLLTMSGLHGSCDRQLLAQAVTERWLTLFKKELQRSHFAGMLYYPTFWRHLPGGTRFLLLVLLQMVRDQVRHANR